MPIPNTRPWQNDYTIKQTAVIVETPELRVVDLTLAAGKCVPHAAVSLSPACRAILPDNRCANDKEETAP